jgi:hypothetical protein
MTADEEVGNSGDSEKEEICIISAAYNVFSTINLSQV